MDQPREFDAQNRYGAEESIKRALRLAERAHILVSPITLEAHVIAVLKVGRHLAKVELAGSIPVGHSTQTSSRLRLDRPLMTR